MFSCKSGGSPIEPIMPDRYIPDEEIQDRSQNYDGSNRSLAGSARLFKTGPNDYLSSELSPPLVNSQNPVFSAELILQNDVELTSDDFMALSDNQKVPCDYNAASHEVSFTSLESLKEGKHSAQLLLINEKLPLRSLEWHFEIVISPPHIEAVMFSTNGEFAVVFFDRQVEPGYLLDESRWSISGSTESLRSEIKINLDNSVVFLPVYEIIYEKVTTKQPFTITFEDMNGPVEYGYNRGGSARQMQVDDHCTGDLPTVTFHDDHHSIENEGYVFGYETTRANCMTVECNDWSFIPIRNSDPTLDFDQQVDNLNQGAYPGTEPLDYILYVNIDDDNQTTLHAPRNYIHDFSLEFWADMSPDRHDPQDPNSSIYETLIDHKHYHFESGFDLQAPNFVTDPTVMYGDEAKAFIEGRLNCGKGDSAFYVDILHS